MSHSITLRWVYSSGGSSQHVEPDEQGSECMRLRAALEGSLGTGASCGAEGTSGPAAEPMWPPAGRWHCTQVGSILASVPRARPLPSDPSTLQITYSWSMCPPAPSSFSEALVTAHPKNKLPGLWMRWERARTQLLNKHRRGKRAYKVLVHLHIIQLVHFVLCHLHHKPRQPFKCWSFSFIFVASRIIFPSAIWLDSLWLFWGQGECELFTVPWPTFCSACKVLQPAQRAPVCTPHTLRTHLFLK